MRILILEDDSDRVKKFYEMFNDHSLVVVNNSKDAISFVTTFKFNVIFLDHDLGGQVYVDSDNDNTGYQVAKVIPNSINSHTPVVIHSWNVVGAKRMQQVLEHQKAQVVHILFGNFDVGILKS